MGTGADGLAVMRSGAGKRTGGSSSTGLLRCEGFNIRTGSTRSLDGGCGVATVVEPRGSAMSGSRGIPPLLKASAAATAASPKTHRTRR